MLLNSCKFYGMEILCSIIFLAVTFFQLSHFVCCLSLQLPHFLAVSFFSVAHFWGALNFFFFFLDAQSFSRLIFWLSCVFFLISVVEGKKKRKIWVSFWSSTVAETIPKVLATKPKHRLIHIPRPIRMHPPHPTPPPTLKQTHWSATYQFGVVPSPSKAATPKNIHPNIDVCLAIPSSCAHRPHQVCLSPVVVQKDTIRCIKKYSAKKGLHLKSGKLNKF